MTEQATKNRLGTWTESRLRVRYCETDAMGIAHHAEYLAWYEVGRTDWIREGAAAGRERSYRQLELAGWYLPVIEVASRHFAPARYDDQLVVRSSLTEATRVRLAFDYEILRAADGQLLSRGRTMHAATGHDGRPRRLQPEILDWLLGVRESLPGTPPPA